jgi:hypothetical protein
MSEEGMSINPRRLKQWAKKLECVSRVLTLQLWMLSGDITVISRVDMERTSLSGPAFASILRGKI